MSAQILYHRQGRRLIVQVRGPTADELNYDRRRLRNAKEVLEKESGPK